MPTLADAFKSLKKFALVYATGGMGALQALKMELFSFPPILHLYLGYFFSIVTIFCIFLGGSSAIDYIKRASEINNKMKQDEDNKPA